VNTIGKTTAEQNSDIYQSKQVVVFVMQARRPTLSDAESAFVTSFSIRSRSLALRMQTWAWQHAWQTFMATDMGIATIVASFMAKTWARQRAWPHAGHMRGNEWQDTSTPTRQWLANCRSTRS
jgi:hypothetical protein